MNYNNNKTLTYNDIKQNIGNIINIYSSWKNISYLHKIK